MSADVDRTAALRFLEGATLAETHVNLSAVHAERRHLWIAGDETATVERLSCADPGRPGDYGDHVTFALAGLVPLPGTAMDDAVRSASDGGPRRHGEVPTGVVLSHRMAGPQSAAAVR